MSLPSYKTKIRLTLRRYRCLQILAPSTERELARDEPSAWHDDGRLTGTAMRLKQRFHSCY